MKKINPTIENPTSLRMTDSEKKVVWNIISDKTFLLSAKEAVRKPILSRLYYRGLLPVLKQQGISFSKEKYTLGFIMSTLIASGTILAFAQETLPGDLLYPVKTNVNEKIQVVVAVTPEEKASVEATLAVRRLEEVEKLVLMGKLNQSTVEEISKLFSYHVDNLKSNLSQLEKEKDFPSIAKVGIFFQTKIAVHAAVLKDIEINTKVLSHSTKHTATSSIILLEKKVLTAVIPTVIVTKKALLELSSSTVESEIPTTNNQKIIVLDIDHNEARNYLLQLHEEIGIPTTTLKAIPAPIVPVFVEDISK